MKPSLPPIRPEIVSSDRCRLGECPIWCDRDQRLWWVDVLAPALWSYDPSTGSNHCHEVRARRLGSIAMRESGGLLLACEDGIHAYDPRTGLQEFLVDPEPGVSGHRKNDGRADPLGNFWIGTLREEDFAPVGKLYRVNPGGSVTVEAEGIAIPNSLAFDAERKRMYFADTRAYTIWSYDQDQTSGNISKRQSFAVTTPPARPDGSCVDAEGCLWNAEYAGGRVVRYSPNGEVLFSLELPVSHPTSCCFGGRFLDTLYVTSAAEPLSPEERQEEPMAGHVLSFRLGISGRPEYRTEL